MWPLFGWLLLFKLLRFRQQNGLVFHLAYFIPHACTHKHKCTAKHPRTSTPCSWQTMVLFLALLHVRFERTSAVQVTMVTSLEPSSIISCRRRSSRWSCICMIRKQANREDERKAKPKHQFFETVFPNTQVTIIRMYHLQFPPVSDFRNGCSFGPTSIAIEWTRELSLSKVAK